MLNPKKIPLSINAVDVQILASLLPRLVGEQPSDMEGLSDAYQLYVLDKELTLPEKYNQGITLKCDITMAVVILTVVVPVLDELGEEGGYCTVLAQKIAHAFYSINQYRSLLSKPI